MPKSFHNCACSPVLELCGRSITSLMASESASSGFSCLKTYSVTRRSSVVTIKPVNRQLMGLDLPFDPGTDAARTVALGVHINNDPRFKASHPWPGFVRLGYKSLATC